MIKSNIKKHLVNDKSSSGNFLLSVKHLKLLFFVFLFHFKKLFFSEVFSTNCLENVFKVSHSCSVFDCFPVRKLSNVKKNDRFRFEQKCCLIFPRIVLKRGVKLRACVKRRRYCVGLSNKTCSSRFIRHETNDDMYIKNLCSFSLALINPYNGKGESKKS